MEVIWERDQLQPKICVPTNLRRPLTFWIVSLSWRTTRTVSYLHIPPSCLQNSYFLWEFTPKRTLPSERERMELCIAHLPPTNREGNLIICPAVGDEHIWEYGNCVCPFHAAEHQGWEGTILNRRGENSPEEWRTEKLYQEHEALQPERSE